MEREIKLNVSGWFIVLIQIIGTGWLAWNIYTCMTDPVEPGISVIGWVVRAVLFFGLTVLFSSYCVIQPNESAVLTFTGKYKGTMRQNGFVAKNPFWSKETVSLRVMSHQCAVIKVNDKAGVPIEIAAVMTYQTMDTYKEMFAVENISAFIQNQFEVCLRELAKKHLYNELVSLDTEFIAELEEALEKAGQKVLGAKITTLNFATEISGAMLQKQEAIAMSEARQTIVDNALKMADHAKQQVQFVNKADESKFVANLILVLCSERPVTTTLSVND